MPAGAIRKKLLSNRKKILSNRKKVLSKRKIYWAIGNDCQSNRKKAPSNRKKVKSKRKRLSEQSEKGTEQSENGTEQSKAIADAVKYNWSSKCGRLPGSKCERRTPLAPHDCWAIGARVLMLKNSWQLQHVISARLISFDCFSGWILTFGSRKILPGNQQQSPSRIKKIHLVVTTVF